MVYHVLNRGVGRMRLFHTDADYAAWERVILETLPLAPMRICAYCWMPNHWHLVLWPESDGELSTFMQRATNRHTQRWHAPNAAWDTGISTRVGSSRSPSTRMTISTRSCGMSSGTRCGPALSRGPKIGGGAASRSGPRPMRAFR